MSNTFRPSAPTRHTVVEEGTEFKGTLTSSCPIDVRGRIEGELSTPSLTVSASGAVHGRAKVGSVHSEGELSGEFDADSIELAGSVCDNTVIRARSLEVKLSSRRGKLQVIFGECELAVGEEPRERVMDAPVDTVSAEAAPEARPSAPPAEQPELVDGLLESQMPGPAEGVGAETAGAADEPDEPGEATGKRRRKRKNGSEEEAQNHWSQPPSQPPPAS